jgi:hypothetical protein
MNAFLIISGNIAYFSKNLKQNTRPMKTAEILLHYMDELQKIVGVINSWLEKGMDFFQKIKAWVQKVIEYIEQAIDALVQSIGGRRTNLNHMTEEYLFV